MLTLKGVTKIFNEEVQIRLKPMEFKRGKSYLVLGASGSGKSTMLNMIGGFVKPSSGSVVLKKGNTDIDITSLNPKDILRLRRENIGYIVQDFQLFEDFTVRDNICLKETILKEGKKVDIKQLLDLVGLGSKIDVKVKHLSGGEKQRVAIARTLISNYDVLLCDEPTGSLNRGIANDLMSLIVKTHKQSDNILIVVSHDESMSKYFDEVIYFEDVLEV